MYKECPSSTCVVYKECPSSSSSVQGASVQAVAPVHKECPSLYTGHAQIGHWLGHVYISKQYLSLGTPSVTAWTWLVHICEQVSFQVGHSNLYSSVLFRPARPSPATRMKPALQSSAGPQLYHYNFMALDPDQKTLNLLAP